MKLSNCVLLLCAAVYCAATIIFLSFRLLFEALDSILSNRFSFSKMSSACPLSRMGHGAAVINDEMLVWGGVAVRESTGEKYYCSPVLIECFNLLTSQWNERRATSKSPSDLPHPCIHPRIGVVQNRDIYQFGGYYLSSDDRDVYLNDVHKLDGSTLEWQGIHSNDQSTPSGREPWNVRVREERRRTSRHDGRIRNKDCFTNTRRISIHFFFETS